MSTPSMERFHDKLTQLAGAGSNIGLAAAKAMANQNGCNETIIGMVGEKIDDLLKDLSHLQATLEKMGKKKTE